MWKKSSRWVRRLLAKITDNRVVLAELDREELMEAVGKELENAPSAEIGPLGRRKRKDAE